MYGTRRCWKLAPVRSWDDKVSEKMFVLCWTVWYSDSKYWSYFHKNFLAKQRLHFGLSFLAFSLDVTGTFCPLLQTVSNCFPRIFLSDDKLFPYRLTSFVIQLQYCTCYLALFLSWNQGLTQKYEKEGLFSAIIVKIYHDEVNTIDVVSFYIKWLCCYKKVYIQSVLWVQGKLATGDTCRHISANSSQVRVQNSLLVMGTLWTEI